MRGSKAITVITGLFLTVLALAAGCGSGADGNPKEVVIQLFGAMDRNERAAIPRLLDMPALMEAQDEDYALQRSRPRKFYNPEEILNDLTDSGLTKTIWFSMQRIVGKTTHQGDTAFVEVSFVDKAKGVQYYNKFGLHRVNNRWKIYSFRAAAR